MARPNLWASVMATFRPAGAPPEPPTPPPDPTILSLAFNSPEVAVGGGKVLVYGDFSRDAGKAFLVYVGPNGDATDYLCLSGIPGRAHDVFPISDERIGFYLPIIPPGGPYKVFVARKDGTRSGVLNSVTVLPPPYHASVFAFRALLPPHYKTGPRGMEYLERIP